MKLRLDRSLRKMDLAGQALRHALRAALDRQLEPGEAGREGMEGEHSRVAELAGAFPLDPLVLAFVDDLHLELVQAPAGFRDEDEVGLVGFLDLDQPVQVVREVEELRTQLEGPAKRDRDVDRLLDRERHRGIRVLAVISGGRIVGGSIGGTAPYAIHDAASEADIRGELAWLAQSRQRRIGGTAKPSPLLRLGGIYPLSQ